MAELQSALLGEYNDEENVFNSCCQSLLYIALFDPGISGKYVRTVFLLIEYEINRQLILSWIQIHPGMSLSTFSCGRFYSYGWFSEFAEFIKGEIVKFVWCTLLENVIFWKK